MCGSKIKGLHLVMSFLLTESQSGSRHQVRRGKECVESHQNPIMSEDDVSTIHGKILSAEIALTHSSHMTISQQQEPKLEAEWHGSYIHGHQHLTPGVEAQAFHLAASLNRNSPHPHKGTIPHPSWPGKDQELHTHHSTRKRQMIQLKVGKWGWGVSQW
jgi:hypothetical protein